MRRRREPLSHSLAPAILDVAIHGWDGLGRGQGDEDYNWVAAFTDVPGADWGALYRAHQAEIDGEAARRGVARVWAADCDGPEGRAA